MVLVPRAFQKYSICMVYSEFLFSGRNPTLEGRGGGGGATAMRCFSGGAGRWRGGTGGTARRRSARRSGGSGGPRGRAGRAGGALAFWGVPAAVCGGGLAGAGNTLSKFCPE